MSFPATGTSTTGTPLSPEESLDEDEFEEDIADGYSPAERPWGVSAWGVTSYEESRHESLGRRLAREQRELTDEPEGDGIGDSIGTDGELIDDQVGDRRAGRLVLGAIDDLDRARTIGPPTLASMGLAPRPKKPPFMSCQTASRPTIDGRSSMRPLSRKSSRSPMLKRWNI